MLWNATTTASATFESEWEYGTDKIENRESVTAEKLQEIYTKLIKPKNRPFTFL